MVVNNILKFIIILTGIVLGVLFTDKIIPYLNIVVGDELSKIGIYGITITTIISFVLGTITFGVIAYLLSPTLIDRILLVTRWLETKLNKMPMYDVIAGALGLSIGLIISNLIGSAFLPIPLVGKYIPIFLSVILGYLGINVAIRKRDELLNLFASFSRGHKDKNRDEKINNVHKYKILDTSVIIDGRIADICKSGFIEGTLIVPGFVLAELQHIADSADLLKRNRGRRGLDILNRMQKEFGLYIQIDNRDFDDVTEVDAKLVKLGQLLKAHVITNDYNLNKVAELQGVQVLNINELSNAIKPVVLPGEEMVVQVVKDGKESGQGVAYLDDGTMIVVDGGKKHMGETIGVLVTTVLQTAAGRMIFAKTKGM